MNIEFKEVTVAIIAGGKSIRFGQPKSFAQVKNRRLIDHAVELAKNLSPKVLIVSGNNLDYKDLTIPIVSDIIENCGPIGGLFTALTHCKSKWILTIPVDMPFLVSPIYQILWQNREENRPVAALTEDGLEPIVALWPRSAINSVKGFIERKKFSLRGPLFELDAVEVYMPEAFSMYRPEFFHNINYKSDLHLTQSFGDELSFK